MNTNELNIHALSTNGLAVIVVSNFCKVLLLNGKTLLIVCNNQAQAEEVKNSILYYPVNKDNACIEMEFTMLFQLINE